MTSAPERMCAVGTSPRRRMVRRIEVAPHSWPYGLGLLRSLRDIRLPSTASVSKKNEAPCLDSLAADLAQDGSGQECDADGL